MYFHLPLNIGWDPALIQRELIRRNQTINSSLKSSEIHIAVSSEQSQWWRERRRIRFRERVDASNSKRSNLIIRFREEYLVRNVQIDCDTLNVHPADPSLLLAEQTLEASGAKHLRSIDDEFKIAYLYCAPTEKLLSFRDRMEEIDSIKQRHIDARDYLLAANAHDLQEELRVELDSFLLAGLDRR
ncbi:hypothetical protein FYK55_17100 [Roseiconus nitratireducens]|uniref:Uncharacterized protein n=1 Tax=Roseiconus nitratireducens TaxID=2605748 RepID=A0A5M6D3K9_9BACT|nr:hypothetical protein [Roseiconus nitratireducens]KAA5541913.1 hypothetical protein FYK55_17100 [Roseiconus nitratireducens]